METGFRLRYLFFGIVGATLGAFWAYVLCQAGALVVDTSLLGRSLYSLSGDWFPVSHFGSNAFYLWRCDPVLSLVNGWAGLPAALCVGLFIFGLGLLIQARSISCPIAACTVMLLLICIERVMVTITGTNIGILQALIWLPWLLAAFQCFIATNDRSTPRSLALLCAAALVAYSANQAAPLIIAAVFPYRALVGQDTQRSKRALLALALALLPWIAVIATMPHAPYPPYSPFGHVVPGYGAKAGVEPLLGEKPPILILMWQYLRTSVLCPALCLCAIAVIALVWHFFRKPIEARAYGPLLSALSLGLALLIGSELFSPSINFQGPLRAFARNMPELSTYPVEILALCCGVALVGVSMLHNATNKKHWNVIVIGILPAVLTIGLVRGPIFGPGGRAFNALAATKPPTAPRGVNPAAFVSPSLHMLQSGQVHGAATTTARYKPIAWFPHVIEASHNPDLVEAMQDSRPSTRWHALPGRQDGTEWIKIFFDPPVWMDGLLLDPGPFHSDFPRGLRVSTFDRCEQGDTLLGSSGHLLVDQKDWQGELRLTSDGFPYYTPQHQVRLHFPNPRTVSCLLIQQTGRDEHYDWSISEVLVSILKRPANELDTKSD